ncbi:MAG TPA: hypothetical protein VF338_10960 [Leptolinea sp.]
MRKTICAVVIVLMCMSSFALADTIKVINQRNEYGGTTNEITLSPTEGSYEDGIETSKSYYDNNGKMVKKEEFYTDQQQRKDGIETSRFYYDNNGKMVKKEDFHTDQRQQDVNDFRCLKSIGVKTPIRLQFVFNTDKPDVGYVIYQNGSRTIAVKMLKEREVRRVPGEGPSVIEAQWEEITSDGTGGKYIIVIQGARINEFRYSRKKDGKLFKFEEDVEAWTEKGCEWNKK